MKIILFIVGGLVVLIGVVALVGALLPKGHVASRSARYTQLPEAVWAAITDYTAFPSWRTDVKSVERLPDQNGHMVWKENGKNGPLPLEVVESNPPARLVLKIADPSLPFGGTWTYDIKPDGAGCRLTITERGAVSNPIFRFMSRFVFRQTATMESYLKALGRKFNEEIVWESP